MKFFYDYSKDVRLPVQLQRAMAAEAEAAREARAKVILTTLTHNAKISSLLMYTIFLLKFVPSPGHRC